MEQGEGPETTDARVVFRTPEYGRLRWATAALTLLGLGLLLASLGLHLPTVLGIGSSLLVGGGATGLAWWLEGRKTIVLIGGGMILPLERPTSDPGKFRVLSEPAGARLVVFAAIREVHPTLHDFSTSKEPALVPGLRILVELPGDDGGREILMAHLLGHPWVDLPASMVHLRRGLADRWEGVFQRNRPLTNRIEAFPGVWEPILRQIGTSSLGERER